MSAFGRALRRPGGAWLMLAGALGLVAALITVRAASAEDLGGTVLVAREPVPTGTVLEAGDLALAAVPSGLALPGLLVDPAAAVGRRTTAPVQAGEPITDAALGGAADAGPAPLRPGERAVYVPLAAAGGAAAGLAAGARVDAVASTGEGPAGRSEIVVADAEVLAVGVRGDALDPAAEASVLVRVSAVDALALTAALNFAREVRLLVRPADEPASAPTRPGRPPAPAAPGP